MGKDGGTNKKTQMWIYQEMFLTRFSELLSPRVGNPPSSKVWTTSIIFQLGDVL